MILVMTGIGRNGIVFQEMITPKELIQRGKRMKDLAIHYDYIHVCAVITHYDYIDVCAVSN